MFKEIIICVVIVSSILLGNKMTQTYTKESVKELSEKLLEVREELEKKDKEEQNIGEGIEKVFQEWEKRHDKLAYFIEHDELEKVETELTEIKSDIETGNYEKSISELDKSVFILKHIQDKYAFDLKNVF